MAATPFAAPTALETVLKRYASHMAPIFATDLNGPAVCRMDFTAQNLSLREVPLGNTAAFSAYVTTWLLGRNAKVGVGGYLENRAIYRRSPLFGSDRAERSIHLGVDLWAAAGTAVFAPLAGTVHSFADNAHFGDYGPTIVLAHRLDGIPFYTLYGHLSRASLQGLVVGQTLSPGQHFTELGPFPENGDWPPHLHFQIITDMEGRHGDFPGVCAPEEVAHFRTLCPDPNLILRCGLLG